MTNADRIRAMTDEELAKWILNICCIDTEIEELNEIMLKHLQSEADRRKK